jgi:hypothetical protein
VGTREKDNAWLKEHSHNFKVQIVSFRFGTAIQAPARAKQREHLILRKQKLLPI